MTSFYEQVRWSLSQAKLGRAHWKVWFLSAMGIFLDGYDLFVISVALPLIIQEFGPSPVLQGFIGSAAVVGMIFGATFGGRITDHIGRRAIYLIDLILIIIFTILSALTKDPYSLIACRFLLGIGIGADYPICASYISEIMPARVRGKMLIAGFSFQALGLLAAAVVGLFVMTIIPRIEAWRWILASSAIPAFIVLLFRTRVFESPFWLAARGKHEEALAVVKTLTGEPLLQVPAHETTATKPLGYSFLFKNPFLRSTVFSCGPWFLMDIAAYGVGVFTPILLGSLIVHKTSEDGSIAAIFASVAGTAFLDLFLFLGFLINIWLVEKLGRLRLQCLGFLGMTIGLLLLLYTALSPSPFASHTVLIFIGFICYNLSINAGPAATTFAIPAEVYPTQVRASGHGFAAGAAKLGAFVGIFLLPVMTAAYGLPATLLVLAFACVSGLLLTIAFGVETKGRLLH